jgi:glycosyltransferase involved in cell wall biosynthesis
MRVLQLGPFPPPNGGVQTNLKAIHDLLNQRGDEGCVIAITHSSQAENVPNVFKPRSAIKLLWLLLTLNFDVVHLHVGGDLTLRLVGLMLICGLLPGSKSVLTFHSGGYASKVSDTASPNSLRGFAFRAFDHVIGVNQQMMVMFRRYGVKERNAQLILPFVLREPSPESKIPDSIERFIGAHRPLLLTVGLLEKEYRLRDQIECLESLLKRFPRIGLMILGSGSLESKLRDLIASKDYAERVFLAGDVDHDVTLQIIRRADVLLRPTDFDGDAVAVREALFLQTPVIASDNGMRPQGVHLISAPVQLRLLSEKISEVLAIKREPRRVDNVEGMKNIEAVIEVYIRLLQK